MTTPVDYITRDYSHHANRILLGTCQLDDSYDDKESKDTSPSLDSEIFQKPAAKGITADHLHNYGIGDSNFYNFDDILRETKNICSITT